MKQVRHGTPKSIKGAGGSLEDRAHVSFHRISVERE
jgi:hypothetical protein